MLGIDHYLTFLVSGILLNLTPGQDSMYILGRSTAQGRKAGLASALGVGAGTVVHTFAAAFGLSFILLRSATAFDVIRYAGAAYLVFLGLRMFFKSGQAQDNRGSAVPQPAAVLFRTGMITNILNPKVALFFLSFLPQFVDPGNAYGALPFILLGLTFVVTGTGWCMVLAWFSSRFSETLRKKPGYRIWLEKMSGMVFLALGLKVALQER